MLVEKNFNEYLEILSSDSPSPGGGSVSSISGGLAVSCMQMVCSVSMNKKGLEEHADFFKKAYLEAEDFKKFFIKGVDEDSQAFAKVIEAFRLPKTTDEEKAIRSEAIQAGYKHATNVPFLIGLKAYEFLPLLESIIDDCVKSAITDAYVSALQLMAAVEGAFVNVRINLNSIKDKAFVVEIETKMDNIQEDTEKRVNLIIQKVKKLADI